MANQQYLGVYSPKNVDVIVAGLTIDGLGEEMIEIERLEALGDVSAPAGIIGEFAKRLPPPRDVAQTCAGSRRTTPGTASTRASRTTTTERRWE